MDMSHNLLDILNSIPIIGHIKGTIQRVCGHDDEAAEAFSEANRTTAVLAAGAAGFYLAGVPLAVLFGTATGAQWDLFSIIPTNGKKIQGICKIADNPSNVHFWIGAFVEVTTDGFTAVWGGRLIQSAHATLGLLQPKAGQEAKSGSKKGWMNHW